jgi:murein tripeptide amidase MpaA
MALAATVKFAFPGSSLSYTLEMPFKDNIDLPDTAYGWSSTRCKQLGEDVLIAMRAVVDTLR